MLLKTMMQIEHVPLLDVPAQINTDLQRFGRINIWHEILPKSFCEWVFNEHIEDSWFTKHSTLCIEVLYKIFIERLSLLHERNFSTIRIEDNETLQNNARNVFSLHNTLPPKFRNTSRQS